MYTLLISTITTLPEVYEELMATNYFRKMEKSIDEAEHSIEMQLPFIAKVMEKLVLW